MKKIIAIIILAASVVTLLAGCGNRAITSLPEGMSGKEAASLMLAKERLNSQLLKNSSNIFGDGVETLTNLAEVARVSLASHVSVSRSSVDSGLLAATGYEAMDGSIVEVDGATFRWSGFEEYSNSYDYFLNLTTGISSTAMIGADLIDFVKKNIRVVDKWVTVGGGSDGYFLHVEKNREVLYSRMDSMLKICIRTKDSDGSNVYEIYTLNSGGGSCRMVYSEGKLCEYSYVYESFNHNFLAVNNKGYWEVVDVGHTPDHYNVSCMVIKNDICYDAFYDPVLQEVNLLKVISADRATDIINLSSGDTFARITMNLQGFSGYDYFELVTTPDRIFPLENQNERAEIFYHTNDADKRTFYQTARTDNVEMVLENGRRIKVGDTFLNENVSVEMMSVSYQTKEPEKGSHIYRNGYVPEMDIRVHGDSFDEQMANFELFLAEVGLSCNRDMSYVKSGIIQAFAELEQFTKYHEWNESPISTNEGLARGWQNNLAKHEAYKEMYESVKNAPSIDISERESIELAIKFSPIGAQLSASVTNVGRTVTVEGLSLTATDTMLFVEGEEYSVFYALVGADNTLNHIDLDNPVGVAFTGGDSFIVGSSASFEIPVLSEGVYTLVAYISTKDGIRSSDYTPLVFTSVSESAQNVGQLSATLKDGGSGEMKVSFAKTGNISVNLSAEDAYTANSMYEALSAEIYNYGFVAEGAVLEVLAEDGSWVSVMDSEGSLASGTYRMKYSVKNGNKVNEGYVITRYTAL